MNPAEAPNGNRVKTRQLEYPRSPDQVLSLLRLPQEELADLELGTARFAEGERVPRQGDSQHQRHEVSVILKGALDVDIEGDTRRVAAGEVTVIPAGQKHTARALEETELIWVFFGGDGEGKERDG